jgi:hypothetical protein
MAPAQAPAPASTAPSRRSRAPIAIILVVALILLGFLAIAVRSLLEQRLAGNEAAALSGIRSINTALYQYRQQHGDSYPKSTADLRGALDPILACGVNPCVKSGYAFSYELLASTPMGPRYAIVARPNKFGNTGRRSFYSDESGVVRATGDNRMPNAEDDPAS